MRYYKMVLVFSLSLSLYTFLPFARSKTMSPDSLYRNSGIVLVARCLSKRSYRSSIGNWIFTEYHFKCMSCVKGEGRIGEFSLKVVGGTIGRYKVVVKDAPSFIEKKYYLLFLKKKSIGNGMIVTGASQGVWNARKKHGSGVWEVKSPSPLAKMSFADKKVREKNKWLSISSLRALCKVKGGAR